VSEEMNRKCLPRTRRHNV